MADRAAAGARVSAALDAWWQAADASSGRVWVGYSGGMDSAVLLEAMAELRARVALAPRLAAVHVNHGLHPDAARWAEHCERRCDALAVPLATHSIPPGELAATGASVEAAARAARYAAFAAQLAAGDVLLLAHHADDQAETLLLRLLQGRGVLPMPATRSLGADTMLARPLLEVPHQALRDYAEARALSWVEDPDNASSTPDRNYLRHQVLAPIRARWPQAAQALARSGAASDAQREALERLLADIPELVAGDCQGAAGVARLRAWLAGQGEHQVTDRALGEFCRQVQDSDGQRGALRLGAGMLQARAGRVIFEPLDEPPGRRPPHG